MLSKGKQMSQALYRKYRPRSLDQIVGQKSIVTSLKNARDTNNISHAYLFTGPRGTGKTSIARILAFELNNIPYNTEDLPLDIIEVDAASNRGIDEIRDLREKVRTAPTSSKYKVYIIDEVHMLTTQAFNALLKTLEEPPAHVIFILATTESHKLPETIISRTEQYHFKLASMPEVQGHLRSIADTEAINIEQSALDLIAEHSGGSLRDSLSLLDQARHLHTDIITSNDIVLSLGLPTPELVDSLIYSIEKAEPATIVKNLKESDNNGVSVSILVNALLKQLQTILLTKTSRLNKKITIKLMQDLLTVESSSKPYLSLEICLLDALFDQNPNITHVNESYVPTPPLTLSTEIPKSKKSTTDKAKEIDVTVNLQTSVSEPQPLYIATDNKPKIATTTVSSNNNQLDIQTWNNVLEDLRKTHNTIYSIVRMAKLDESKLDSNIISLEFQFPFHKKRISENKNQQVIVNTLQKFDIRNYEIVCTTTSKNNPKPALVSADMSSELVSNGLDGNVLDQIKNVFGNAEMIE